MLTFTTRFTIRGTGIIFVGSWVALQTIDGTFATHVLANFAIQTGCIAGSVLMLSFVTFFAIF